VRIDCITFDLDDTLWDCGPVLGAAEESLYGWLAERYPRVAERYTLDALTEQRRTFIAGLTEVAHDFTALRKRWLAHLAASLHYPPEELAEQGFRVFWEARNRVELFDDALDTLERLRGRYRLGAVTNGNACVDRIGIGHYFDFTVTASEAGALKPDAGIFLAALEHARVPAGRVLHVGDDPVNDVRGAAAVGMRTVWVNPTAAPWPCQDPGPDAEVRRVGELPAVLAGRWRD